MAVRAAASLPALSRGGRLLTLYFVLDPAAKALEGKHPLAAVLLRRAMVEDTLDGAKATRYRHAARHLLECRGLEAGIGERGGVEPHAAFVARLRARHGRKAGFWSRVEELAGDDDRAGRPVRAARPISPRASAPASIASMSRLM